MDLKNKDMIGNLNLIFKVILDSPMDYDHWGLFDLYVIKLVREESLTFKNDLKLNKNFAKSFMVDFPLEIQKKFIKVEQKNAIDRNDLNFSFKITYYGEYLDNSINAVEQFRVYGLDYFIRQGQDIHFALSGHPLFDMCFERIISFRQGNYFNPSL